MSTTITVGDGCRVKIIPPNAPEPQTLGVLMARHGVTDDMLSEPVKSMLLDILAIQRGQSLPELLAEIKHSHQTSVIAAVESVYDDIWYDKNRQRMGTQQPIVQSKRKPYTITPEAKQRQRENIAAARAKRKQADTVTQSAAGDAQEKQHAEHNS